MGDPRHELGRRAEAAVAAWLTERGWSVLAARWRCTSGELDLVCLDPGRALVGVEVKLRTTQRAGSGAESLTPQRLRRLRAALGAYAAETGVAHGDLRIDLVSLSAAGDRWRLVHAPRIAAW